MSAARAPQPETITPQLTLRILDATGDLPGADFRILTFFLNAAALGNIVHQTAKAIAEAVHVTPGTASKSINRLTDAGWIEPVYRQGRMAFYRTGFRVTELTRTTASGDPIATVSPLADRRKKKADQR